MGASMGGFAAPVGTTLIDDGAGIQVDTTAAETTSLSLTVSANSVKTGVLIVVWYEAWLAAAGLTVYFRIKTGTLASEVERQKATELISAGTAVRGGAMVYWEDSLTWTNDQSIIFTVQPSDANANLRGTIKYAVVMGY